MLESGFNQLRALSERVPMMVDDVKIKLLSDVDEVAVVELIKRNIGQFEASDSVVTATLRRIKRLKEIYCCEGSSLLLAKSLREPLEVVACAGIGPLHGLSPSEGVGELRDLVVEASHRGQGLGTRLLRRSIEAAKNFGYDRLYLETTPKMLNARKLFLRSGFRPVTNGGVSSSESPNFPCYFLLEDLQRISR